MQRMDDGAPKLWTIHRALRLRRERKDWFGEAASYSPLEVEGKAAPHAIAYLRGESVVTIVPRLALTLSGAWQKTMVLLPEGRWTNWLTGATSNGGRVAIETLLKEFPVALLIREAESNV
jgi:(1->4)-alpha-D-glucan 1-alpha-D-glucosylmutase